MNSCFSYENWFVVRSVYWVVPSEFYGVYSMVSSARSFFEEMPRKNVVSKISLMLGYSDNGDQLEVVHIYKDMRRKEICCNQNTFTTVITSCGFPEGSNDNRDSSNNN